MQYDPAFRNFNCKANENENNKNNQTIILENFDYQENCNPLEKEKITVKGEKQQLYFLVR
jgi:hypothetical protein